MIIWESILSAFDERGTLLKWLQTVDKALKDAVLSEIKVNTISDDKITLSFVFADGNEITTPQITLPRGLQGEKGDPGEKGEKGDTGAGCLVVNQVLNRGNTPKVGFTQSILKTMVSEYAVLNDFAISFVKDNSTNLTYIVYGQIIEDLGTNWNYKYITISPKINGEKGDKGDPGTPGTTTFYRHCISCKISYTGSVLNTGDICLTVYLPTNIQITSPLELRNILPTSTWQSAFGSFLNGNERCFIQGLRKSNTGAGAMNLKYFKTGAESVDTYLDFPISALSNFVDEVL